MKGSVVYQKCPHCSGAVAQWAKLSGPNVCPHCYRAFSPTSAKHIPVWVWGFAAVVITHLMLA